MTNENLRVRVFADVARAFGSVEMTERDLHDLIHEPNRSIANGRELVAA